MFLAHRKQPPVPLLHAASQWQFPDCGVFASCPLTQQTLPPQLCCENPRPFPSQSLPWSVLRSKGCPPHIPCDVELLGVQRLFSIPCCTKNSSSKWLELRPREGQGELAFRPCFSFSPQCKDHLDTLFEVFHSFFFFFLPPPLLSCKKFQDTCRMIPLPLIQKQKFLYLASVWVSIWILWLAFMPVKCVELG